MCEEKWNLYNVESRKLIIYIVPKSNIITNTGRDNHYLYSQKREGINNKMKVIVITIFVGAGVGEI